MPDPAKLKSFLERTQRAMQDAVSQGDQAGVDQYENFLDRANQVGERMLGQQGPQGQQGATGLAGMVPTGETPPPPQLTDNARGYEDFARAQQEPQPQLTRVPTLVGGPQALANSRAGETNNPFTLAGVGTPNSALQQMVNGVPKAPPAVYNGPTNADTSGYVPKQPPVASSMFGGFLDSAGADALQAIPKVPGILDSAAAGIMGASKPSPESGLAEGIGPNLQRFGEWMDPSLKPNLGKNRDTSLEASATPHSYDQIGLGDPQPNDPELKRISLQDAIKNTTNKPDIQAELLKLKQQLGNKPTFFTLQNLAMLLLMGAPKTYAHFKGQEEEWNKDNQNIDMLGLKYKFGKTEEQAKTDHWHEEEKLRRDELGARLAHDIAHSQQQPVLDQMKDLKSEMRGIRMNPQFDPNKADSPLMQMLSKMQSDYDDLSAQASGVPLTVYKKK